MAAKCPPAEWPITVMFWRSPPCSAMWRQTQAEALAYYNLLKDRMKVQVKVPAPKPGKDDEVASK
jgi:hypothetical protein